ncbi:MAG: GDP-mannose 4,6-dehydratase [Actinobacteria bacterium]|nr:GDP-mannose 4,6-dehydratase [Actinomycetota bacterium]
MRSLVTGGAGFIGSTLVDALLARGDEVTIVDNLSTGRRQNIEAALGNGARLVELDIRDRPELEAAVGDARPQVIFHLAAQIDVRVSVADAAFDASINIGGTANVLDAVRAGAVPRLVFASTGGAIYGEGEGRELPLGEHAELAPFSPYGQSKQAAELYLSLYHRLYGLSSVCLRLGNVYGPRQDPLGEAGVIAIFCGLLREGGRPTVFGDGLQTRDYIFVEDVVAAMIAAADSDVTGPVNVGTGIETDVLALARALGELAGTPFEAEFAPPRTGEVQAITIDPARAAAELGWHPRTSLADGLRITLDSLS